MKQYSYGTSSPASPPTVCASSGSAPSQSRGEAPTDEMWQIAYRKTQGLSAAGKLGNDTWVANQIAYALLEFSSAHAPGGSDDTQSHGGAEDDRFWIEVRDPRCVPQLKGPFRGKLAPVLREFMDARPTAYLTVLSWGCMGPMVQDAPEALQMADGRSMARGRRHIQSSAAAHSVSDGSPAGVKTGTGLIEDDSAVTAGQTPHPSPVDYTEVVERLNNADGYDCNNPSHMELISEAAQVIEAQAAERDHYKAEAERQEDAVENLRATKEAAEARIAELEKERNEARVTVASGDDLIEAAEDYFDGWAEAHGAETSRSQWKKRALVAESRLADAVKVIEDLMETGFNVAETPTRQRARSFLSTGGDSHG